MNAPKSHYINHCSCEKESEPLFWTYGKVKPLQCFKCCSYVFIIATISPMPTTGYLTPIGWQARMKLLWSWPQSAICSPRSCQLHWHINHLWFSDHSKHLKKLFWAQQRVARRHFLTLRHDFASSKWTTHFAGRKHHQKQAVCERWCYERARKQFQLQRKQPSMVKKSSTLNHKALLYTCSCSYDFICKNWAWCRTNDSLAGQKLLRQVDASRAIIIKGDDHQPQHTSVTLDRFAAYVKHPGAIFTGSNISHSIGHECKPWTVLGAAGSAVLGLVHTPET